MLTANTIHAFKWSVLGEAASRFAAPLTLLVLARILLPDDFGVVAAATVVISLSQALAEAGLGKALVQRQDRVDECAAAVFWLNMALAVIVMVALAAGAPLIAGFFKDPRITDVVRVLSLQVPLAALCTVPSALLQRDLQFRQIFWVRLVTAALPALVSIPLALAGHGYWALVASSVAGQAVQAAMLWQRSRWRPGAPIDWGLAVELMSFGKWAVLSGLLTWGYAWADAIIVGHYLGATEMGLYRTGNTLATMLFGLVFAPVLPVLYTLFSRVGHDRVAVSGALMISAEATVVLSLPVAALIVFWSNVIEATVFGAGWGGLASIIALLAAGQGLGWLVGINGEAYRAVGRPQFETWSMGISIAAYLVGYLVSIQFGLMAFVATRAGLTLVGIAVQIAIAKNALGLPPRAWARIAWKPLVAVVLSCLLVAGLSPAASNDIVQAIVHSVILLLAYAALTLLFNARHRSALLRYIHAT